MGPSAGHGRSRAPAQVVMAAKKPCCGWKHIIAGLGLFFLVFLLLVLVGLCVVDWTKMPEANKDGEFRIESKAHVKKVEKKKDANESTWTSRMRHVVGSCPGKVQIFFMVLLMTIGFTGIAPKGMEGMMRRLAETDTPENGCQPTPGTIMVQIPLSVIYVLIGFVFLAILGVAYLLFCHLNRREEPPALIMPTDAQLSAGLQEIVVVREA